MKIINSKKMREKKNMLIVYFLCKKILIFLNIILKWWIL